MTQHRRRFSEAVRPVSSGDVGPRAVQRQAAACRPLACSLPAAPCCAHVMP